MFVQNQLGRQGKGLGLGLGLSQIRRPWFPMAAADTESQLSGSCFGGAGGYLGPSTHSPAPPLQEGCLASSGSWCHLCHLPTPSQPAICRLSPPSLSFVFGYSPSLKTTKTLPLSKTEKPGKSPQRELIILEAHWRPALDGFLPKEIGSLLQAANLYCVFTMCQVLGSYEGRTGTSSYVIGADILERECAKGRTSRRTAG